MTMSIKILIFTSILIWLFPPLRQYKQNYFWFFLFLALTDPFALIIGRSFGIQTTQTYLVFVLFYFFSILGYNKINLYKIVASIVLILIGAFSFFNHEKYAEFYFILVTTLMLLIITKNSFQFIVNSGYVNFFHIVLVFYMLTSILKFWNLHIQFDTGIVFFFVTGVFQIFVGLFFSVYRENNPKLLLKIGDGKQG